MIIDREGNEYYGFLSDYGIVIEDNYKDIHFGICLPYENPEDVDRKREINKLKDELHATDYKLYKFMDGSLTEEEYAPIRTRRQACRDKINELEALMKVPTITPEEIRKAEEAALAKKQ